MKWKPLRLTSFVLSKRTYARFTMAAIVSLGLAPLTITPALAQAGTEQQDTGTGATRQYAIPAGPLNIVLTRFSEVSGVFIAGNLELARDKTSSGLNGRYDVQAALNLLLAGTGYQASKTPEGYVIEEKTEQSTLPAVKVSANVLNDARTEDTGSYTTGSTNTATGLNLSLKETPQSVTVMTRERIEDQGLDEISEVLDQTVGISANIGSSLGTDGTNFYSRGFRVENFQVDGAERPSTIYGFEVSTADMAAFDRVEIVRGATGLLNGVGTPAATINLVRKKPTREFQSYVSAQTGSWNHYRLEGDVSGSLTKSGGIRGRFVTAYQENDSFIDREHLDKHLFYGVVEVDIFKNAVLTAGAEYQEFHNKGGARVGLPFFYTDGTPIDSSQSTNTAASWASFYNDTLNLFSSLDYAFGQGWNLDFNLEYSDRYYDDTLGYLNGSRSIERDTGLGSLFQTARWNGYLEQTYASIRVAGPYSLFGKEHELVVGASYSKSEDINDDFPGWWSGPTYSTPVYDLNGLINNGDVSMPPLAASGGKFGTIVKNTGAYAATQLRITGKAAVILGTRITNWSEEDWNRGAMDSTATSGPTTKEEGVITPYAGLTYNVTENISAYASYSDIFNPQTNEDINGDRLDPVTGTNYEIGLKSAFYDEQLNASLALFRIKQDNYAVSTGFMNPKGNTAFIATNGTESNGYELEVTGEVLPGWQVGGGYSHTEVEDRNGDPLETYVPEDSFKLMTSYQLSGYLEGLTIGSNVRWQSDVYREDSSDLWPNVEIFEQEAFFIVDLMTKYAVTDHWLLTLNINNLFDKAYFSGVGYSGRYGVPRQMLVAAKYSF